MKNLLLALALGLAFPLAVNAQTATPEATTAEAAPLGALDFFLGVWRTTGGIPQADGSYTRSTGMLTGERAFLGSPIANVLIRTQSFKVPGDDDPFGIPYFEDVTIYTRNPTTGQWGGVANNTLGNRKWRDVTVTQDEVIFDERGEAFQGTTGEIRFTYYDIQPDSFEMRVDYRENADAPWQMGTYRMSAVRIG